MSDAMTSVRRRSILAMVVDLAALALNVYVVATGRGTWLNAALGVALIVTGCALLYWTIRNWRDWR